MGRDKAIRIKDDRRRRMTILERGKLTGAALKSLLHAEKFFRHNAYMDDWNEVIEEINEAHDCDCRFY